MRHRADQRPDRGQRRGIALAPANLAAGGDPDQRCVLAVIGNVEDFRCAQIKDVDGIDLGHGGRSLSLLSSGPAMAIDYLIASTIDGGHYRPSQSANIRSSDAVLASL